MAPPRARLAGASPHCVASQRTARMNGLSSRAVGLSLPRRAVRGRVARSAKLQTFAVAAGPGTPVKFKIKKELQFGDRLAVVGSADMLGKWDAAKGLELVWSDGHVWQAEVTLPSGMDVEYKCVVVRGSGEAEWEGGNNRSVKLGDEAVEVVAVLESAAHKNHDQERDERRRRRDRDSRKDVSSSQIAPPSVPGQVQLATHGRWQGKDINFMK